MCEVSKVGAGTNFQLIFHSALQLSTQSEIGTEPMNGIDEGAKSKKETLPFRLAP